MEFEKLKSCDPSIKIFKENSFNGLVEGITTIEQLKSHHLIFVKDKKYYSKLLDHLKINPADQLVLFIGQSMVEQINQSEFENYLNRFSLIVTVADLSLSICLLSKVFYDEFTKAYDNLNDGRLESQIDPSVLMAPHVFIGKNVKIGKNVMIHSGCNILSGSSIGDDTILYPNVTIYSNVFIGSNCRIHASSVIGADGFGYYYKQGIHHKIWHYGGVVIGNNVEVGACSTIDAGTFVPTTIGDGSKIDNLVQIAHNCTVKNGVIFCGQSALSGSCQVGNFVVFAGKSGMGPDTSLGDGSQVGGGALVSKDWPAGAKLAGHPAREVGDWLRSNAFIQNGIKKNNKR
ncbi:MAG: hypothetical protein A2381_02300 [Bdellovibrionales bacterium RIFOXYB1_FULL_37_110]|nr:MAG: hypothetical protein A2417_13605 [Bdellovibrionales bacterium RIFOXYC1_FULL_37_79]OFZ59268.1 MAG: hypothetical protein A2381_02300 [Bdellovibrionales bacterium RIFOXYB1_FULL_37_110]OFZ62894.1 MAG: hypothetical protein A2577_11255 [Bdellovibrionales bacterium RIFOXYD1_FULL_36_51]